MKKQQKTCEGCYALNKKGWCRFGISISYDRSKMGDSNHMPMATCTPVKTKSDFDLVCIQSEITAVKRPPYMVEYYQQRKRKKADATEWRWRLVAPNLKIVVPPESHPKIQHAKRAAENVAAIFKNKYVCYRELI